MTKNLSQTLSEDQWTHNGGKVISLAPAEFNRDLESHLLPNPA